MYMVITYKRDVSGRLFSDQIRCSKPPDLFDAVPSEPWNMGTVIYKCKEGFNFIKGSGLSICQESGLWSIPKLFCARE